MLFKVRFLIKMQFFYTSMLFPNVLFPTFPSLFILLGVSFLLEKYSQAKEWMKIYFALASLMLPHWILQCVPQQLTACSGSFCVVQSDVGFLWIGGWLDQSGGEEGKKVIRRRRGCCWFGGLCRACVGGLCRACRASWGQRVGCTRCCCTWG